MRLTCPNCAAQYEIDATLVPDGGRDVQCSGCDHTWFQRPLPPEATDAEPTQAEPTPVEPVEAEPRQAEPAEADQPAEAEGAEANAGANGFSPPRKELDPMVRSILQEEAHREVTARRDESLADPAEPRPAGPEPRIEPEPEPETTLQAKTDRKPARIEPALLSRPAAPRAVRTPEPKPAPKPAPEPAPARGAGTGFATVLILFVVLVALYLAAPLIAGAVPLLEPALSGYVEAVNALRAAVAGLFDTASA